MIRVVRDTFMDKSFDPFESWDGQDSFSFFAFFPPQFAPNLKIGTLSLSTVLAIPNSIFQILNLDGSSRSSVKKQKEL